MKTLIVICFLLAAFSSQAQKFVIKDASITVYADTISIIAAFEFTDLLLSGKMKAYDRYVIKNDTTYYRAGIGVFRRPPVYILRKDGSMVKAHIKE